MRLRGKILISIFLVIIIVIALWQFTSPRLIPTVGTKYVSSTQYANRGSWVVQETTGYGRLCLVISIANQTYPRTAFQTIYSVLVSKANETLLSPYVRGFTLKITGLHIQDNYDGSTSSYALPGDFLDAVQATTIFNFKTTANHQLMFTITYTIYEILPLGSLVDRFVTRSFNVTQNVI